VLIIRLSSLIILVLLSGCASSPIESVVSQESDIQDKPVETKVKVPPKEVKTAIAPEVLYMLLAAELAGQRGQYEVALEGYMEAAKRVDDPRFAERAASIAMYMKNSGKTDEALSIWLSQDPKGVMPRKLAALSALRSGEKSLAVEHINALIKADPVDFEDTLLELVGVLQKEDKAAFVFDVLETVSKTNADIPVTYFVQSLLAMQINKKDVAEQKVQKALALRPNWDSALILQAQIALAANDVGRAKQILLDATKLLPDSEKIKKMFGQLLVKNGEYSQAVDVYQALITKNPKDTDSQFNLALLNLQLGLDKKAEDLLTGLLGQAGWRERATLYLGRIEESRGNSKKALGWFDKVVEGPYAFESAMSGVSLLAKDKQFNDASSRLDSLTKKYPNQKLRITLIRASIYNQQGQFTKAFDLLTQGLVEQPDQKDLLYTRAIMAGRLGKLELLKVDLKKILLKNPDDFEALNALGYSLLDDPKSYDEAEIYLNKALKLRPAEAIIIDSYGWLQFKLGRLDQALSYLEQAYEKQPEGEIAAHLCEVLWVLGRQEEAKAIFSKAVKDNPADEYLLGFQKRVLNGPK